MAGWCRKQREMRGKGLNWGTNMNVPGKRLEPLSRRQQEELCAGDWIPGLLLCLCLLLLNFVGVLSTENGRAVSSGLWHPQAARGASGLAHISLVGSCEGLNTASPETPG